MKTKKKRKTTKTILKTTTFLMMITFLAAMSAWDAYINLKYPIKAAYEENPLARLILQSSGDNTHLLIAVKLFTTSLALSFLTLLFSYRPGMALTAAGSVTSIYAVIMAYMVLA